MGWLAERLEQNQKEALAKAFKADGLQMLSIERKSEIQILREENEWLSMVLRDCENKRVNVQKKCVIDMTRPQPCTEFMDVSVMELTAKLVEKTHEVIQKAAIISKSAADSGESHDAEVDIAEKLTGLITFCTSWLHYGLGYDEHLRGEVQIRLNEKNLRRGNIGDDAALSIRQEEE